MRGLLDKTTNFLFISFFIAVCTFSLAYGNEKFSSETLTNELPMYGGIKRTPNEKQADDLLVKSAIEQCGSREAAVKRVIELAWYYHNVKHDPITAMKRFNQAWLLDPNTADAFFGFGFLVSEKGDLDLAIKYFQKAIELDPAHVLATSALARRYKDKAYKIMSENNKAEAQAAWEYLNKALDLYEKSSKLAKLDDDRGYIYYQWAVALELIGNYAEAWAKVKLSRKYNGSFIESGFIDELSRFMSEPK